MEASQRQNPPPEESLTEEAALAALVVILLSDLSLSRMQDAVALLFAPLGIAADAARAAVAFLFPHLALLEAAPQTALAFIRRTQPARQAAYVLRAAQRLGVPGAEAAERRFLKQHLDAERARREVAAKIDAAVKRHGPVLGWKATMDRRTTAECRENHGKNFSALTPPAVGWPGTLHGGACRCAPVAPWPDAEMLD